MPINDRSSILHHDAALLRGCFDALADRDPGLGRIMAATALTGLRTAEMEMLAADAVDLVEGTIEPLCHSVFLKTSYRVNLVTLPISRLAHPLLRRLVEDAVRLGVPTLIEPGTTIRRWHRVRDAVGPGFVGPHTMRRAFAEAAREVCDDPMIVDRCLWRRSMRRLGAFELLSSANPRKLDWLFDAVADRLAPIVLRPAFTTDPG